MIQAMQHDDFGRGRGLVAVTGVLRPELLEATDEQIEDALEYADPLVLLGLLYQLTGDEELAAIEATVGLRGYAVMPVIPREEDVELVRRKAVEFLKEYRDSGAGEIDCG